MFRSHSSNLLSCLKPEYDQTQKLIFAKVMWDVFVGIVAGCLNYN